MPIFDQGYQHWKGQLSGHAWRWLAITRHGVRIGMQGRVFRAVLLVSLLPAMALATALCIWGLVERRSDLVSTIVQFLVSAQILSPGIVDDPRHYRLEIWTLCYNFFLSCELTLSMILILLVGPNLISQDLRFNALPLYLSRPLRRIDYLAGKLGVIAAFLGLAIIVPCLLSYGLGLLFSLDFSIVKDTYRLLLASVAYGVVIILSAGMLILALSSLTRNSRWVALFFLGIWIVSNIASGLLELADREQRRIAFNREMTAATPQKTPAPKTREERRRRMEVMNAAQAERLEKLEAQQTEASKSDWRPLVSYTGNLSRVGRQLLRTDACWEKLSEVQPLALRKRFLATWTGPQYPWYWSAGVLSGLFVLSAVILSFSVRSLDRLR
ncbi:MAG TPA: ABC transporter permease subunit [Planctomycetaceae bacterium]|nr:ABC transporter permease subunit [Planctomycetaceae bacterium]